MGCSCRFIPKAQITVDSCDPMWSTYDVVLQWLTAGILFRSKGRLKPIGIILPEHLLQSFLNFSFTVGDLSCLMQFGEGDFTHIIITLEVYFPGTRATPRLM